MWAAKPQIYHLRDSRDNHQQATDVGWQGGRLASQSKKLRRNVSVRVRRFAGRKRRTTPTTIGDPPLDLWHRRALQYPPSNSEDGPDENVQESMHPHVQPTQHDGDHGRGRPRIAPWTRNS